MVASLERWRGTQALRRSIWRRLTSTPLLCLSYYVFTGQPVLQSASDATLIYA